MTANHQWSINRRSFLLAGGAGVGALLWPASAIGAGLLINPYSGSIPLTFPLTSGTYQTPVVDTWHAAREGSLYPWNHRNGRSQRAHDGVDVYPVAGQPLPPVYAPLSGTIAAVCLRSDNTVNGTVTYRASQRTPPPWNYSQAVDTVANLPMYGNFVWIRSTDATSAGYFVFFCHLQNEALIQGLVPDEAVTATSAVGVLGDTGNATGSPQLHAEIHYPSGSTFSCRHCAPKKMLTSVDSFASLQNATIRAG